VSFIRTTSLPFVNRAFSGPDLMITRAMKESEQSVCEAEGVRTRYAGADERNEHGSARW
jgi:hypothetical protein